MLLALILTVAIAIVGLGYWFFMSSYSQVFGKYPYRASIDERLIALTFDDGPNEPYTSQILEFLAEKNIKATFFMVGKCIERYPEISQKIVNGGHVIGNHSLSHKFYKYFTSLNFTDEILANQVIIKRYTGQTPALFRSPWLWRQPWLLKSLSKNGLQPISGKFCHALEVFRPDANKIAKRAVAKATPGSILIFHDGIEGRGGNRQQTVDAVKITVEKLLKDGYYFTTVDKLLNIPAYQ